MAEINKDLFHRLAEDVATEWQCGGLTGTMYEEYAEEILSRYLDEQAGMQSQKDEGKSLYLPSEPMVQMELAARSVFDKFSTEWPKVERDLKNCKLQVINSADGKSTQWIVKGMPTDKAEIYNERYAKPFASALIGVLNIQTVSLEFQVKSN